MNISKKEIPTLLQLKTYRVKLEEEPYIRINTRNLNGVSKYNLFT